ncbi:MAG: glycosyltransferase, partial [Alphaproteobacteria bacterium]|nr:glycosyltransferase [Alphaproteobacteria bacterium]
MSQVLFSIITVVRNNINTIEKAILSVVENKPDFIEYVVIDGQSTDGTLDVINKYKDKIDIFISEKDSGATNAMAKGAKLAKGKYIGYVFADDFYEGDIFNQARIIVDNNAPDIISLPCKFVDEKNQILRVFQNYDQKSLNIYNALYY